MVTELGELQANCARAVHTSGGPSPLRRVCRAWHAGVWTRIASRRGDLEPIEIVNPAHAMCRTFCEWEAAVLKVNPSPPAVWGQTELDRGGAGWQVVGAGVAPADDHPVWRFEVQVAATYWGAFDIEMEPATGFGFEQCVVTHPGEHCLWFDEVLIHALGWRVDVYGRDDRVSGHAFRPPRRA
jgi:hypothetical protein